jgi:hypothetical protein
LGARRGVVARAVAGLLRRYGLDLSFIEPGQTIPASYWGAPEAGLRGTTVYARGDTPLHSILHETGHYICMDATRRRGLDTDAGGDDAEECAVCYLCVLLADDIDGYGRDALFADMDAWGYSFRLGAARAWFGGDAGDARAWLQRHRVIGTEGLPTTRLRMAT